MTTASPTITRDEIAVVFSRDEANAANEGLKHADATAGFPARDARLGALGKIQAAIAEAAKPAKPAEGATGATGAARGAKAHG